MIYLRYRYERAGVPPPPTVALHTEGIDWIDDQVAAEFSQVFPGSRVLLNPTEADPSAFAVLVYRERATGTGQLLTWARHRAHGSSRALGFYCVDPRRFDVVRRDQLLRWARRRRLEALAVAARLRFPGTWVRVGLLYRRCAFFS